MSLHVILSLFLLTTAADSLGIGSGPFFIGGLKSGEWNTYLDIYKQYIRYKVVIGESSIEDAEYHKRWTERSQCIGGCPQYSFCSSGICVCDSSEDVVQVYGRCFGMKTVSFIGDKDKYRKPTPPPRPEWCFCKKRDGGREVCTQTRGREECQVPHYPNMFDHTRQMCRRGDHNHCLGKDINMYCSENTIQDPTDGYMKHLCECRPGMVFDTESMECRIFIDVDCTHERRRNSILQSSLAIYLKDDKMPAPDVEYSKNVAQNTFCNLMDSNAKKLPTYDRLKSFSPTHPGDKKVMPNKSRNGCINPKGADGDTMVEGCLKKTCKKNIWRVSLDPAVCCFEGKPYPIGTSLPTVLSDDGCGVAHHQCVLQDGQAVLQLHVENICSGYATKDQARELKTLVEHYVREKC